MGAIKGLFGWLGRRTLLYLILVAALVAATLLTPWIKNEWTGPRTTEARLVQLGEVRKKTLSYGERTEKRLTTFANKARESSIETIDRQLVDARSRLGNLTDQCSALPLAVRFARDGAKAVWEDQRRKVQIRAVEQEIAILEQAKELMVANSKLRQFGDWRERACNADRQRNVCNERSKRLQAFEQAWFGGKALIQRRQRARLKNEKQEACNSANALSAQVKIELKARSEASARQKQAERAFQRSVVEIQATMASVTNELDRQMRDDEDALSGSLQRRAQIFADRVGLNGKLETAAWALLVIITMPYLIRIVFYFVLAPVAVRRSAIRLPQRVIAARSIPPAGRSTMSVSIRLSANEELLVKQDYLQSSAVRGAKSTRWLLDWRHPLSSMVTGLVFLTRIRGEDATTTVSAVRDPFAEVTVLALPDDSGCVLHPRALAAVVQPIERNLRVTSHWRLTSLNAWLTMQLRYLVFHGPARLIIKGGRGVKVEPATDGRVFGQDQLIGFSANLAYSVSRTETFWPYFFGREQLLKDRVEGGTGTLIVEEAPINSRAQNRARGGLEGAMDAALKVFGL